MKTKSTVNVQFCLSGEDAAKLRVLASQNGYKSIGLAAKSVVQKALDNPTIFDRTETDFDQVNRKLLKLESLFESIDRKFLEQKSANDDASNKIGRLAQLTGETYKIAVGLYKAQPQKTSQVQQPTERRQAQADPEYALGMRPGDRFRDRGMAVLKSIESLEAVRKLVMSYRALDPSGLLASESFNTSLSQLIPNETQREQMLDVIAEELASRKAVA